MIAEIYVFLFFTSVLLLIVRSQPASIAWIVTSTAAFTVVEVTWNILYSTYLIVT